MAVFYPIVKKVLAGKVEPKDYNFYDYDGTLLYSYTEAELASLAALPVLPKHEGLTCQGWNWTLDELKAEGKETDVGAIYTTDDGATRLYITIPYASYKANLRFLQSVASAVTINWGDGSSTQKNGNTSVNITHTYAEPGDYVITLTVNEGATLTLGNGSSSYSVCGSSSQSVILEKVEIGERTKLANYAFVSCIFLESLTIPSTDAYAYAQYAFYNCQSLLHLNQPSVQVAGYAFSVGDYMFNMSYFYRIVLPAETSAIRKRAFDTCKSLSHINLPNKTNLNSDGYCFSDCTSLHSIVLPESATTIPQETFNGATYLYTVVALGDITSLNSRAFNNTSNLGVLDLTACTTVPSVQTNTFSGYPSGFRIYVPAALYDEWIVATNWAALADYIVAK